MEHHVPIEVTDYNHVRLTVSDIDRSRSFYDAVFGFEVAYAWDPDADEETKKALWFLWLLSRLAQWISSATDATFFNIGLTRVRQV